MVEPLKYYYVCITVSLARRVMFPRFFAHHSLPKPTRWKGWSDMNVDLIDAGNPPIMCTVHSMPWLYSLLAESRPMMFMDARLLLTPLLCRAQSIGEAFISLVVKCDVFSHMGAAPYQVKPLQANTPPSPATSHLNHWCGSALE